MKNFSIGYQDMFLLQKGDPKGIDKILEVLKYLMPTIKPVLINKWIR